MAGDVRPESVAGASFRVGLRGYDQGEVRAYLDELAASLAELLRQHGAALAKLREYGDRDPAEAIDELTRDLNAVLHAAHEAAANLRVRTDDEISSLKHAAATAAQKRLSDAEADAYALRKDAWDTGTKMLDDVVREVAAVRAQADKDVLTIVGEAERNAHRKLSNAARDAEQQLRSARLESERMKIEAQAERDELLETARRSSDAAQERAQALERRRDELLEEIERMRAAEQTVPESPPAPEPGRRSTTVRIIDAVGRADDPDPGYEPDLDEIKVIRPESDRSASDDASVPRGGMGPDPFDIDTDLLVDEVRRLHDEADAAPEDGEADDRPALAAVPDLDTETPAPDDDAMRVFETESEATQDAEPGSTTPERVVSIADLMASGPSTSPDAETVRDVPIGDVPTVVDAPAVEADGLFDSGPIDKDAMEATEPVDDTSGGRPVSPHRPPADHFVSSAVRVVSGDAVASRDQQPRKDSHDLEIGTLFEQLRIGVDDPVADEAADAALGEPLAEEIIAETLDGGRSSAPNDVFALRDEVLLPVTNRVLRAIKRQLSEVQNVALEALRVDPDSWDPRPPDLAAAVGPELMVLHREAFSAGVAAAALIAGVPSVVGVKPQRTESGEGFSEAFTAAVVEAVGRAKSAGQGTRELGSSVSRIYRTWRVDESDRRVRHDANRAYSDGLRAAFLELGFDKGSLVVQGVGCDACRSESDSVVLDLNEPDVPLPPRHADCSCTIIPV